MGKAKTFVTVISMQGMKDGKSELKKTKYKSQESSLLLYNKEIRFPITAAINGYAEKGDKIKVVAVRNTENDYVMRNDREYFVKEMDAVREEKGIPKEDFSVEYIDVKSFVGRDADVYLFKEVINKIHKNEELYFCITYGTKSVPIVLFSVANYLEKVKNALINCILYGNLELQGDKVKTAEIYDMTQVYYNHNIFLKLAELGLEDPLSSFEAIKNTPNNIDISDFEEEDEE